MLLRIVRMEFQPEKLQDFLTIFNNSKQLIRAFSGCDYLALHSDAQNPNVRYTYSKWTSEDALNEYRNSALFGTTWAATKVLFAAKPQAFSLRLEEEISL